jgi:hypothetical protein
MQKTIADPLERAAIMSRLQRLTPASRGLWGRMTAHQAICHLSDSLRSMMAAEPVSSVSTIFSRTVIKWVALRSSMKWPHGVPTRPEVDQEIGGTRPGDFSRDRRDLEFLIEQFAERNATTLQPHPMFGRLSTEEWQRWGYLHVDHHLRQFGV